jgi:GDP-D-mannose dehydratase
LEILTRQRIPPVKTTTLISGIRGFAGSTLAGGLARRGHAVHASSAKSSGPTAGACDFSKGPRP